MTKERMGDEKTETRKKKQCYRNFISNTIQNNVTGTS
jgi:hypothetical protein